VLAVSAFRPVNGSENEVILAVHAVGWAPLPPDRPAPDTGGTADGGCRRGDRAGQVGGRPAYQLANGPAGGFTYCVGLMWQRADQSWVELRTLGFGGTANQLRVARQAAEAARLDGVHRQVRMPFTAGGRLRGLEVAQSDTYLSPGAGTAEFPNAGSLMLANPGNHKQVYLLCAATSETSGPKFDPPNTTVDGHPATVRADQFVVYGVGGCRIQVEGDPAAVPGSHTLVDVYRLVHPVREPATPANWTTHPLG
jgi:hypothetical protein